VNRAALHDDTVAMQNDNLRVAVDETDFCHRLRRGDAITRKIQDTAAPRFIQVFQGSLGAWV
jgi:hypothetical protein